MRPDPVMAEAQARKKVSLNPGCIVGSVGDEEALARYLVAGHIDHADTSSGYGCRNQPSKAPFLMVHATGAFHHVQRPRMTHAMRRPGAE